MIRAALAGYILGAAASLYWLPAALRDAEPYQRQWAAPRRRTP